MAQERMPLYEHGVRRRPSHWPDWPRAENRFLLIDKVFRKDKWDEVKWEWLAV